MHIFLKLISRFAFIFKCGNSLCPNNIYVISMKNQNSNRTLKKHLNFLNEIHRIIFKNSSDDEDIVQYYS